MKMKPWFCKTHAAHLVQGMEASVAFSFGNDKFYLIHIGKRPSAWLFWGYAFHAILIKLGDVVQKHLFPELTT